MTVAQAKLPRATVGKATPSLCTKAASIVLRKGHRSAATWSGKLSSNFSSNLSSGSRKKTSPPPTTIRSLISKASSADAASPSNIAYIHGQLPDFQRQQPSPSPSIPHLLLCSSIVAVRTVSDTRLHSHVRTCSSVSEQKKFTIRSCNKLWLRRSHFTLGWLKPLRMSGVQKELCKTVSSSDLNEEMADTCHTSVCEAVLPAALSVSSRPLTLIFKCPRGCTI